MTKEHGPKTVILKPICYICHSLWASSINIYPITIGKIKTKNTKFNAKIVTENFKSFIVRFDVLEVAILKTLFFDFFNEIIIKIDNKNIKKNGKIIELINSIK